ncbi:putative sodium-dependent excitatory amino acid transporter glt-4 isoform X2 [Paramacrobiotus metropolitanus]|uniref:putative sodium-dependent excitatory amino acid transporter glt-4 isoform X2 n=1 Tax=Paramacrobiotus metropolitanus TaxID=2943436 RepID=UPI0024459578|nr:putative sodium-dependent excitatory amino acid transporter glt-4 isoform X2 [Paramacrobiotus metropolitanus]
MTASCYHIIVNITSPLPVKLCSVMLLIGGICCGVGLAFGLRSMGVHESPRKVTYVLFIGDLFLSMLKCVTIPLMVSSIITGLSSFDNPTSGQIGFRSVLYYLITVFLAVCVGIGMVTAIRPGYFNIGDEESVAVTAQKPAPKWAERVVMTADTIMDLVRNMFPPNIIQACFARQQTELHPPPNRVVTNATDIIPTSTTMQVSSTNNVNVVNDSTNSGLNRFAVQDYSDWIITRKAVEGTNIVGIVVCSLVCGIAIAQLGEHGKPFGDFFRSLNCVITVIVRWIMRLAPIGICFLVAGQLLKVTNLPMEFAQLGMYMLTVLCGLCIHAFVVLPLVCFVITRQNPYRIILGGLRAYATGFGTASSAATLPVTMECCKENNKVDERICDFTLPIATAINLDGTALYEAVAAIFIAQNYNVTMDLGKLAAVSVTAAAAAVGAQGIPEAGLVTLVMVLDAVGLPANLILDILAVDWLLDRFRTVVNILGDVIAASVIEHLCKDVLTTMDDDDEADERHRRVQHIVSTPEENLGNINQMFRERWKQELGAKTAVSARSTTRGYTLETAADHGEAPQSRHRSSRVNLVAHI